MERQETTSQYEGLSGPVAGAADGAASESSAPAQPASAQPAQPDRAELADALGASSAADSANAATHKSKAPGALCHKCPFVNRAMAKTTGPADAKIAIVSRSPGHYEALNGQSFAGSSGKVLDHLLELQGTSREDVLATNVVLCQSDGTESGWGLAVECCRPRLEREIAEADTVIACGREAAYVVQGVSNIGQNRGYVHKRESSGLNEEKGSLWPKEQRVIITNNPAVVVRDDATFPELVRDFRLAISPLPAPKLPQVRWVEDVEEAKAVATEMLGLLRTGGLVAVDIETRGTDGKTGLEHTAGLVCCGFSLRSERAMVFGEGPCSDDRFRRDNLLPLL